MANAIKRFISVLVHILADESKLPQIQILKAIQIYVALSKNSKKYVRQ